jgi:hypothetical protein
LFELSIQGDGHCIAHAASQAMSSDPEAPIIIHTDSLVELVMNEAIEHSEYYRPWCTADIDVIKDITKWATDKVYSHDSADLLLHMLSNAARVSIVKVEEDEWTEQITETLIQPGRPGLSSVCKIFLVRHGEHYNCALKTISNSSEEENINSLADMTSGSPRPTYAEMTERETSSDKPETEESESSPGIPEIKSEHTGFPYRLTSQNKTATNESEKQRSRHRLRVKKSKYVLISLLLVICEIYVFCNS